MLVVSDSCILYQAWPATICSQRQWLNGSAPARHDQFFLGFSSSHCHRHHTQSPIPIIFSLEKCITQCHSINLPHGRIVYKIRIDKEKNWHIHSFPSIQPLLFKAETLDLAEIWRHLRRRYAVRSHPYDIAVALVGRSEEGQGSLSRKHANFSLLGREFPWHDVGDTTIEGDAQAAGVGNRGDTGGGIFSGGVSRFDRLATPAHLLAYGLVHGYRAVGERYRCQNGAQSIVPLNGQQNYL